MALGLVALLDDMAAMAKTAMVSLDDIAAQTMKASGKAAGVVIDDAAVTPRYVVGLKPERELPVVFSIARGSLLNKALLIVAILLLGNFLPWIITPLLIVGGVYLAYEGTEKVLHSFAPKTGKAHEEKLMGVETDPVKLEKEKVSGAIRTDFILSAEIMALTFATVTEQSLGMQIAVLIAVGILITVGVYGVVALIVKADDVGLAMARMQSRAMQVVGRGIVKGMPVFLTVLATVGTAAMLWVGGQIVTHGAAQMGFPAAEHVINDIALAAAALLPVAAGLVTWLVSTLLQAVVALIVGGIVILVLEFAILPAVKAARR